MNRRRVLEILAVAPASLWALRWSEREAFAGKESRSAMYPLVGPYRNALRKSYPTVYRYLNVVDIGHAELAETLLANRGHEERAVHQIEQETFAQVQRMFLNPREAPRLAPAEETIAPESAKVAPRLDRAFDWTHILHRQIYDILATDFPFDRKKQYIREAYAWYRTERSIAFPGVLKTHDLMEHQWFSQYWRQKYPRFNGAIWSYHWYQIRLNEVMLEPDKARRNAAVAVETAEFRAMFEHPDLLPEHMPMAHTSSPRFLGEFPEIASTFDNLHSFHDIYNDILAHPQVTEKQRETYRQLDVFLDPQHLRETAPMEPLPADLSREDHRRLNQLDHVEHMAMMVMPVEEQLRFFRAAPEERAAIVEKYRAIMAKHWSNFEKKHAEMGQGHRH